MGASVLALAAWLGLGSTDGPPVVAKTQQGEHEDHYGGRTSAAFVIENSARAGVWALKSPVMETFSGYREPPANAAQWLLNGATVLVRCARPGTPYEFRLAGHAAKWHFFAELESRAYVPMAGFRETSEDGAQQLINCEEP